MNNDDPTREMRRIAGYEAQQQGHSLGTLIKRTLKMSRVRPGPPRNARFAENMLRWDAPRDDSMVTHYRIRVDTDSGSPAFEVSSGQRAIQLFAGNSFVLTAYNSFSNQESAPVFVGAQYGANGNIGVNGPSGLVNFNSIVASLTDPTDYGLRFWMIRCNYTTTITDAKSIVAWVENPEGAAVERIAQAPYITGQANAIYFVVHAPKSTQSIRVYLTAESDAWQQPLRTVADFGEENSSPHRSAEIGPVPTENQGAEWAANITVPGATVSTYKDSNGITRTRLTVTFTPPVDSRWAGVEVDARRPGPVDEQLARVRVSPTSITVESPVTQQTWRIFFRSFDTRGKTNTLNDSGQGVATPFIDVVLGSNTGTMDAAKIQQSTLSSALQIANQVLGIKPLGITEDLIGNFAISKAKLANAPIISAINIEDLAVRNEHVENLAASKILAGTLAAGVIYTGSLSAAQITTGTLSVDRIGGWSGSTIQVGGGLTFSGSGGITLMGGGDIHVSPGSVSATSFNASSGGFRVLGTQVVGARQAAITNPTGGGTQDAEARSAIASILARLRAHGLIES